MQSISSVKVGFQPGIQYYGNSFKSSPDSKSGSIQWCRKTKEDLSYCWWEFNMIQLLRKSLTVSIRVDNITYDPTIWLLGIYTQDWFSFCALSLLPSLLLAPWQGIIPARTLALSGWPCYVPVFCHEKKMSRVASGQRRMGDVYSKAAPNPQLEVKPRLYQLM